MAKKKNTPKINNENSDYLNGFATLISVNDIGRGILPSYWPIQNGAFAPTVPLGNYQLEVFIPGFKSDSLQITFAEDGIATKTIELTVDDQYDGPKNISIAEADGDFIIDDLNLNLLINAENATQMRFSESLLDFEEITWQPFASSISMNLDAADSASAKTIYFQFRNGIAETVIIPFTIIIYSDGFGADISVTSNIDDAAIFLNGVNTGLTTPQTLTMPQGLEQITVAKSGYQPSSDNNALAKFAVPNAPMSFDVSLSKEAIDNPLPVELSPFSGVSTENGVVLSWKTLSEKDNAGFVLSRNGVEIANYQTVEALNGAGTKSGETNYSFTDAEVELGETYTYKLASIDFSGERHEYETSTTVTFTETARPETEPTEYALSQNYPNPFNPSTTVKFSLKQAGTVTFEVFDILGRVVYKEVLQGRAGENAPISFDGKRLKSGVYFYRISSGSFSSTKKMMLLK